MASLPFLVLAGSSLLAATWVLCAGEAVLRDLFSDTWVATDGLGRQLPTAEEAGPPRADRTVGIFYFLWHGEHIQGGPYDVTKILAQDAGAMEKKDSPLWGPLHAPHHWGESIFGYYLTNDEGVLRKHAQMLADAGVDVAIFDVTNQLTYRDWYRALLRVWSDQRRLGNRTPQVAFLTPFGDPRRVVHELWHDLYEPGLHRELWFVWDGKPLILADSDLISADGETARIREFFTFRKPQPDYFKGPTRADMWSWLEVYPQHVFRNARHEKEEMSVGVAQNAVGGRLGSMSESDACGRSYHEGRTDRRPEAVRHGYNVAEQWQRVLAEDPRFVFLTGWNEWIAGRFDEFNGVRRPVMFVDQFDQEHSRDIEPMRGGHGDDYYCQMASYIRRYKGVRAPARVHPQPIQIDGSFADWRGVDPEFRDTIGDPVRRRHRGWDPRITYSNETGRNDLIAAKVSSDGRALYVYARTREPITPRPEAETNWMLWFLDVDANTETGWLGYDFVVNRQPAGPDAASVERNVGRRYEWTRCGEVELRFAGNEMECAIPWAVLGLQEPPRRIDLKMADGIQETGDWSDFTFNGDVAPNDRFNYRAWLRDPVPAPTERRTAQEKD